MTAPRPSRARQVFMPILVLAVCNAVGIAVGWVVKRVFGR